jgi:heptosyltransferase II
LLNDIRVLDKAVLQQTVQRYVAHAYANNPAQVPAVPFPALHIDHENQQVLLAKFELSTDKPIVCMMPGAEYGPAKQWPLAYYAELAHNLVDKGWQVWVLGSDKDREAGDAIAGQLPGDTNSGTIINLCGKTQLVDTVDLLALAKTVVSNDSGLMHVAAAAGTMVNVIYGSSTPDYTPPLTSDDRRNIFYLRLDCSPCFKRECPLGHTNCLKEIKVSDVLKAL